MRTSACVGFDACWVVAVGAHGLVAGEHGAQYVDSGLAELGRGGEQVVHAWRLVALAALDVAPDQRGDREVLLAEPLAPAWVRIAGVGHRSRSESSASR